MFRSLSDIIYQMIPPEISPPPPCENEQERQQRLAERENRRQGNLNTKDGYNCDICKNKGFIVSVGEFEGSFELRQKDCKCMKARASIRNLISSGLKNVIYDFTFDKYKAPEPWQQSIKSTAQEFAKAENNNWFFIGGQSGSGKTHICTAIVRDFLLQGKSVKYMSWKEDARSIKDDNYNGNGDLIKQYKTVDVLYIDDLFKCGKAYGEAMRKPTEGDINLAFEILNARLLAKRKTIISSENTIVDLWDIDEATAGRIKQMCGPYCITINGANMNYRLKNRT